MAVSVLLLTVQLTCLLVASSLTGPEHLFGWRNAEKTRVLIAGGFRKPFLSEPSRKPVQHFSVQRQEEDGATLYLRNNGRAKLEGRNKFADGGIFDRNWFARVGRWNQKSERRGFSPASRKQSEKQSPPYNHHVGHRVGLTHDQKHGEPLAQKRVSGFLFSTFENPPSVDDLRRDFEMERQNPKHAAIEKVGPESEMERVNQKHVAFENLDAASELGIEKQKHAAVREFDLESENQKHAAIEDFDSENENPKHAAMEAFDLAGENHKHAAIAEFDSENENPKHAAIEAFDSENENPKHAAIEAFDSENENPKHAAMEAFDSENENPKHAAIDDFDSENENPEHAAIKDFDMEDEKQADHTGDRAGEEIEGDSGQDSAPSVCGDGLCRCSGVTADCSRHYGRLTYIPQLPLDVKTLNFSYNGLTAIASDSFFANVTRIVSLDLHHNGLRSISPGAFRQLTQLREVFLGFNAPLSFTSLAPVLSLSSLSWLDLNDNALGNVPEDLFQRYPMPGLVNLNLKANGIEVANMSSFRPLKQLLYLELAFNQISTLVADSQPSLFTKLNLDSNILYDFPQTCSSTGESLFPNLQKLLLGENRISSIPAKVCLPKLQYLSLRFNVFSYFLTNAFSAERFPSLRELYLDWMEEGVSGIEKSAFNNSGLLVLSLMSNTIPFASPSVHPAALAGCGNLSTLNLQHNDLNGFDVQAMLSDPASLQYLGLQSGGIETLDCQAFSQMTHLSGLYLSSNRLTSLPDACFDSLPRLQSLTLWGNRIDTVKPSVFGPSTRQRLRSLDLSENPFRCDSGLDWLCGWMKAEPEVFARSRGTYSCANLPNATVGDNCSRSGAALWGF